MSSCKDIQKLLKHTLSHTNTCSSAQRSDTERASEAYLHYKLGSLTVDLNSCNGGNKTPKRYSGRSSAKSSAS